MSVVYFDNPNTLLARRCQRRGGHVQFVPVIEYGLFSLGTSRMRH